MVPLNEQGLDSLLAVALRNRLASALDVNLPASLLFDFPTISDLLEHLASDVLGLDVSPEREEAQTSEAVRSQQSLEAEIVELSDIEAEDLLQQELENLTEAGSVENE